MAKQHPSGSIWQRGAQAAISWRLALFLVAIVVGGVTFPFSQRLEYDRSIENMFSSSDPLLADYRQFQRTFGNDRIVLLVYEDPDLWSVDGAGIERVAELTRKIRDVPGIRDVFSLGELNRLLAPMQTSIRDLDHPLAAALRDMFVGYTHSEDRQVAAVVCMLDPMTMADPEMQQTIFRLRELARTMPHPSAPGFLVGESVLVSDSFQYVELDADRLGWISSLLLSLTIIVCLRSLRWVVISLLVVQWAVIMTRGSLAAADVRMSMVSSMLTAVVTVIAVATVLHVAIRFRDNCACGLRPGPALQHAFSLLAVPIFWACATDAVGFLSLLIADVGPVRDFGWMMAIGALLVFPAVFLLVPLAALLGRSGEGRPAALGERRLEAGLARLAMAVMRHPRRVAIGLGLLLVFALLGASRLQVETDFTRNFRAGSPIAEAYDFVEQRLGGAGVWDIMIPAPPVLTEDYLARVRQFQEQLRALPSATSSDEPALTKVLSLVDALDVAKVQPGLSALPAELRARGLRILMPDFVTALRGVDSGSNQSYLRIMLRSHDRREAAGKRALIAEVTRLARENFAMPSDADTSSPPEARVPSKTASEATPAPRRAIFQLTARDTVVPEGRESAASTQAAREPVAHRPSSVQVASSGGSENAAEPLVTGYFVLLTHLVINVLRDQWTCFGVCIVGVGLMIAVALRSTQLAFAALVSNAFPILLLLGALGWWGVKLNMGAAMIAAVSMGLSVDGSIHYLFAFRRARLAGETTEDALRHSQQTVGRAMVFATLALVVGFLALCVSQFVPTVYFGILGSLSLGGGLLGNLIVLPLLLKLLPLRQFEQQGTG